MTTKYLLLYVLRKAYRFCNGVYTSVVIKYGRLFKKGDEWIAHKLLGNMSAREAQDMITVSRISNIAEGMRSRIGISEDHDLFVGYFGMSLRGEYISPEFGSRINQLFDDKATVKDAVDAWLLLNEYRPELIRMGGQLDPVFFDKFLAMPIHEIKGFAVRQEDYDKL